MTNERFQELVKELRDKSMDTMLKKNANYADEDRLHNFKVGAAITGGTPAQAALGYMAKHLASLQDKVRKNDFHDREDLLEKCQDIINYVVFIWCCGNEELERYAREAAAPTRQPLPLNPCHSDQVHTLSGASTDKRILTPDGCIHVTIPRMTSTEREVEALSKGAIERR